MTVLVIHGYNGTPDGVFLPELKQQLEKVGTWCLIPAMPNSDNPKANEWLSVIKQTFDTISDPVLLVGHSLGTRAALLFLEQYPVNVSATLLVAAFANTTINQARRNGAYASFFDHEINIATVKERCSKFVVMHSTDDPAIEYSQAESIAADLGAELKTYPDRRHFSKPQDADEIYKVIQEINN